MEERARPHRPERHVLERLEVGLVRVTASYGGQTETNKTAGKGGKGGG